jgi:ribosomal protein S18 acetylase RimI-like enzyme
MDFMRTQTKHPDANARRIPYIHRSRNDREIAFRRFEGPEDHQVIADISQKYWDSIGLDYVISADDVARALKYTDNFNPERNLVIAEVAGIPSGFTQVNWYQETAGPRIYRHITRVTPEGMQHRVNQPLVRFAEGRLRELARRHPINLGKYYATTASETDRVSSAYFETQGYLPERYFFDMVRPLGAPIPGLSFPDGIELRSADSRHYRQIFAALDDSFLDHWGHRPITESEIQWYFESPHFQPELWKVAWEGQDVVGMVLNYIDKAENECYGRKRGYTEDIAVRRPWRRKGVAKTLIALSLEELKTQGMHEAALGVDTQNPTGALRLYQGLGYKEVRKSTNYRKKLSI